MSGAFIAIALSNLSEIGILERAEVLAARRGLTKIFSSDRIFVFATATYEANLLDDAAGVIVGDVYCRHVPTKAFDGRSEEHTSELQSLMRISYAVFCLQKKKLLNYTNHPTQTLQLIYLTHM